jgi:hypothetical protein
MNKVLTGLIFIAISLLITSCNEKPEEKTFPETEKDTIIVEKVSHFLFVGKWYGKAGVYKYDLSSKKHETVWWHPRENVKLLISKAEAKPSFFFTIRRTGTKGNFPYFDNVKIYRIGENLKSTEFIYEIPDGMQITARWNDDENLEVIFTAIDKTDPTYINRQIKTFDSYGKLFNDEVETFNLVTDGFPELLPERNPTVSASGKYGISLLGDSVYLKTAESDSLKFITGINHNLNEIGWSGNEQYLFISTLDLENKSTKTSEPETSELFVYSIVKDSVVASWEGAGIKNFFTFDSLLVFDNGFGRNSSIVVYNYLIEEMFDIIKIKGECGLFYIPEL